jgi:hypothetical protein
MFKDIVPDIAFNQIGDLPTDALNHDEFAERMLARILLLPAGSVVALHGGWGTGKTDILARMAKKATGHDRKTDCIWINPWQYGTADLLTPLVAAILERAKEKTELDWKVVGNAARTVVRAGVNFGCKAAGALVPGFGIMTEAADAADSVVDAIFDLATDGRKASEEKLEPDPVAMLGKRFRELLQQCCQTSEAGKVLICVDDLDRCLPERQVALLEAFRFMTSANPPAVFVIALDPTLARQAILSRYGSMAFDPDQYLDKMFHLRLNVPVVRTPQLEKLVEYSLKMLTAAAIGRRETQPTERSAERLGNLVQAIRLAGLDNPRLICRLLLKLTLYDGRPTADDAPGAFEGNDLLVVVWLLICERWPEARAKVVNDRGDLAALLEAVDASGEHATWQQLLSAVIHNTEKTQIRVREDIIAIEQRLVEAGL